MASESLETQIGKALVAAYGSPEEEHETIRKVRSLVDRHRPKDEEDEERFTADLEWWLGDIPNKRREHKKLSAALGELKWYLEQRDPQSVRAVVRWVSEHPGQAAAAMGVLIAVILRVSYSQFYDALGTTPEEVGLGSPELLAASLPGALIIVAAITAAFAVAAIPQMAVVQGTRDRWLDEGRGQQRRGDVIVFAALVALNVFGLYLVFFQGVLVDVLPVPSSASAELLGFASFFISYLIAFVFGTAAGSLVRAGIYRHRGLRPYVSIRAASAREASIAYGPSVALAFLLLYLPLFAAERADRVKEGMAVDPVSILGFPLLGIQAKPSNLVKGRADHGLGGCVLYLGADDKNAVFVKRKADDETETVVRLPSSEVGAIESNVAERSDDKGCWAKSVSETADTPPGLTARLRATHLRARAGNAFRVRYTVSRRSIVGVTARRVHEPVAQVVEAATRGPHGVNFRIESRGTYALTLVAYGRNGGRVIRRGRVVVE